MLQTDQDVADELGSVACRVLEGIPGDGCPVARRPDGANESPYVLTRWDNPCGSTRSMPITAGKKLTGDNATCVVGDDNVVACIDADFKHGFVLQPSGSWTF